MKNIFTICLFFVTTILAAQKDTAVNVPGTRCSIILPEGFELTTNFSGFIHVEHGASIMISELPAAFDSVTVGFTSDALLEKGMELKKTKKLKIQNNAAFLYEVNQKANDILYVKYILVFGDSENTIIVNGLYPASEKKLKSKMIRSLKSTTFNKSMTVSGEDIVSFVIDVKNSGFKFTKLISGSLLYTRDSLIPTQSQHKELLIVGTSFQEIAFEKRQQYCISRVKALPYGEKNEVIEINPITLQNMDGYEIVARGFNAENEQQMLYQILVFTGTGAYYIMLSTTIGNFEENLNVFREIGRTFRLR